MHYKFSVKHYGESTSPQVDLTTSLLPDCLVTAQNMNMTWKTHWIKPNSLPITVVLHQSLYCCSW